MRTKTEGKQEINEFTKANVKRSTNKIINKIAIDEDKFVYQLIEDIFREKYPEYFRQTRKVTV